MKSSLLNDMNQFDAIVIGGGILGCFAARNLRRWNISVLLLEREADVCTGITRANSAICYAGYDNKPGSRKAEMTVRGNANMEALCRELDVPFQRCGSLLVTYDAQAVSKLERKLENGLHNGVPGLRMLTGAEAEAMEPMLRPGVAAALYAPSTGTVNPWVLGIAAYENALKNGAKAKMNEEITAIRSDENGYCVETTVGRYHSKVVINCAGLTADKVQELAFAPSVRLRLDGAEYLILDPMAEKPERIIFHQGSSCGKGITAIPCVEGNLMISGVRKDVQTHFATTAEGMEEVYQDTAALFPDLDLTRVIRSFGAVRPNPYRENGENIPDFCVENPDPGFYSLIGIKTPGLTCANELGMDLAKQAADYLKVAENPEFDPTRQGIRIRDDDIICQCQQISRSEIAEAIRRGATTVDGVKRRAGTGMGRCQGSRCTWEIEKMLEDARNGKL